MMATRVTATASGPRIDRRRRSGDKAGSCVRVLALALAVSTGGATSLGSGTRSTSGGGGPSSGGAWCQVLAQWAQRTVRPVSPKARASTRYRVEHCGQVNIIVAAQAVCSL